VNPVGIATGALPPVLGSATPSVSESVSDAVALIEQSDLFMAGIVNAFVMVAVLLIESRLSLLSLPLCLTRILLVVPSSTPKTSWLPPPQSVAVWTYTPASASVSW
jgi:hypothetical protein